MFTGIIEEVGWIERVEGGSQAVKLTVRGKKVLEGVSLGDSIAVNGVCLTVTRFTGTSFVVDVMPETLRKTSLDRVRTGTPVNLERAMALGDRFGGHIVSGHVDGVGTIYSRQSYGNAILFRIKALRELLKYMVPKGSITIDGISLTIIDVTEEDFTISIIPHTLEHTNLQNKQPGDIVNLENDMLAKYVERLLTWHTDDRQRAGDKAHLGLEYLKEHGFA